MTNLGCSGVVKDDVDSAEVLAVVLAVFYCRSLGWISLWYCGTKEDCV